MGNAQSKELTCKSTGMTMSECRLVQDTWRTFCRNNKQSGVLIFGAFLTQNPHLLPLFRRFRAMPLQMLTSDPAFRAHACSVAYQITAMVDNADDPVLLEALIRKNALAHTTRQGVYPQHFESLARVIVEVMQSKDGKRQLTTAALVAWKKLLEFMITVISNVYQNEGIKSEGLQRRRSSQSDSFSEECASAYETCVSGERILTTVGVMRRASGSVQSASSRGTLFASSKVTAAAIGGTMQAKEVSAKPELQNSRDQKQAAPPEPTRRSSDAKPIASTSSDVTPHASNTPKITLVEVASDKPRVSSKNTLVPSASSSAVNTTRRASADAELSTDSANRCRLAKGAHVLPPELVTSINKAKADKGSLLLDARTATAMAWDTGKPSADSVSVRVEPVTERKTREAGPSASVNVDAMPKGRAGDSEPSGIKKKHSVTEERLSSTNAGLQLPLNVHPESACTKKGLGDDADASATPIKGRLAASDVTSSALRKEKDAHSPT